MNLPTHMQRVLALDPFDLLGRESARPFAYGVDVREDADKLILEAELPGFKKNEIEIVLDKSVLTITATRTQKAEAADNGNAEQSAEWLLRERRGESYERSFHLPRSADGATVDAKLEDGVLTVVLTKREETKPRKITVS